MDNITITPTIISLVEQVNITQYDEKPCISRKRPFGNSDYYTDVMEELDLTEHSELYNSVEKVVTEEGKDVVDSLLERVTVALEILVTTQELTAGEYQYNNGSWELHAEHTVEDYQWWQD